MRSFPGFRALRLAACAALAAALQAPPAHAFDYLDGRVQVHGFFESQLRTMSDGFRGDRWYWSQWAQVLNVEIEWDIAPEGIGPFDSVGLFVRGEVRFDCIWSQLCGLSPAAKLFGNRANRQPENLANGETLGRSGVLPVSPQRRVQNTNGNLVLLDTLPAIQTLIGFGGDQFFPTISPVEEALFSTKSYRGSLEDLAFALGPWQPEVKINPIGQLGQQTNPTGPDPDGLPLRPKVPNIATLGLGGEQAHNLYVPSQALLRRMPHFDSFDQNFTQSQLQWNRGASQEQTRELKEAYLDLDMLEGRLFLRLGRQTIVWGKTELFPVVDQMNPFDFALTTLPSLEESRIPLWSVRGIYSFYDVGPLQDVRLELAVNLDRFQPNDIGKCGEPYAAWLVCGKSFGLFAHGLFGVGIAGEQRPDDFWESTRGLEFGARLEFRWERFSFAITNFWGYNDFPFIDKFNQYERRVDPATGRPLDVNGNLLVPENALALHPANRQLFDVTCSATGGLAADVLPALETECFLDLLNSQTGVFGPLTTPLALSPAIVGTGFGETLVQTLSGVAVPLDQLNQGFTDGPQHPNLSRNAMTTFLTVEQQALLGCGPFYAQGTQGCNELGIDLFNAEASVLLQAFPQFEDGGPVATRFLEQRQGPVATRWVDGQVLTLPGARTIFDPAWDAGVDGCVASAAVIIAARAAQGLGPANAALCDVPNPNVGIPFPTTNLFARGYTSEMQALSANFLKILAAFGAINQPDCDVNDPITCDFVQAIFQSAGTQRPDLRAGGNGRFGRRDFAWSSGAEAAIRYRKRNVFGISADFAEDVTKTNWSVELTWTRRDAFENTQEPRGFSFADGYNLTISVDRPTFVNFLNPGRTFLINMQWFLGYIEGYRGNGAFTVNGPFNQLGTLSVLTGYFQDRLLPAVTAVHDVQSNTGALLAQVAYRYTESFSVTVGASLFYGEPQFGPIPLRQIALQNNGGDFEERFRFNGLSAVAERDELFVKLRYTF